MSTQLQTGGLILFTEQVEQFEDSCSQVEHWGEQVFGTQVINVESEKSNIFGSH